MSATAEHPELAELSHALLHVPPALRQLAISPLARFARDHRTFAVDVIEVLLTYLRMPPPEEPGDQRDADLDARDDAVALLSRLLARDGLMMPPRLHALDGVHLGAHARFSGITFRYPAPLAEARCAGAVVFDGCTFVDGTRTPGTRVPPSIRLLRDAEVHALVLRQCRWRGTLRLAGMRSPTPHVPSVRLFSCSGDALQVSRMTLRALTLRSLRTRSVLLADVGVDSIDVVATTCASSLEVRDARAERIGLTGVAADRLAIRGAIVGSPGLRLKGCSSADQHLAALTVVGPLTLADSVTLRARWRDVSASALDIRRLLVGGGGDDEGWLNGRVSLGAPVFGALDPGSHEPEQPFETPFGPMFLRVWRE